MPTGSSELILEGILDVADRKPARHIFCQRLCSPTDFLRALLETNRCRSASSESDKWKALERPPIFAVASPYTDTLDVVTASGVSLVCRGAEALLLDCIGFVEAHRRQLAHASGLPVILSNALMAKVVGEMVAR